MDELAVGLVGAGHFARLHARVLNELPGVRVAAICDRDPAALAAAADLAQDVPRYHDLDSMLTAETLGALDVVTDEQVHAEQALAGLERGLPLFVEKPLATTAAAAREIEAKAEAAALPVLVGYVSRFDHRYALVKAAVDAGELGDVVSVSARRGFSREWFAGFGTRVHPVFESMIHDIDLALWYLGAPVRRVYAQTVASAAAPTDVPDVLAATLTAADGRVATLHSAWLSPAAAHRNLPGAPLDPHDLAGTIDAQLDVVGSRGAARVTLDDGTRVWTDGAALGSAGLWPAVHGRVAGAIRAELEHFVACARGRRPSEIVPLADSVAAVEIAEAIVDSAARDAPVEL